MCHRGMCGEAGGKPRKLRGEGVPFIRSFQKLNGAQWTTAEDSQLTSFTSRNFWSKSRVCSSRQACCSLGMVNPETSSGFWVNICIKMHLLGILVIGSVWTGLHKQQVSGCEVWWRKACVTRASDLEESARRVGLVSHTGSSKGKARGEGVPTPPTLTPDLKVSC